MTKKITVSAPAKINRFLHIVGQRNDGYHLLQTVFQLISLTDEITLTSSPSPEINRIDGPANIPPEEDLVVKAARLLQKTTKTNLGCTIKLQKNIPMGAGLGGGSSDAASVLWGLNELWDTQLTRADLMTLGLELGADVPFFLFGQSAFAEGIGEILHPVNLPQTQLLLIYPGVNIPTIDVFKSPNLTRNHPAVTMSDFIGSAHIDQFGSNDCESVVTQKYQEVAEAITWLKQRVPQSNPRMSGSGSSVFATVEANLAKELLNQLPQRWKGFVVRGLNSHPSYNPIS
ncbi:4-(cytidine 5'-diphospho)-2-C-methyl-D-erythritol kinase [Polynucleobacter sp. MWH-Spelu-300-X4]|uniref:4-(cytidine 5'-diphospho)-2-C-methyl-D-erythritol kinase n=1 Tax=Polynucleobacter sp. MWH-Spelu-300-X4 TaxID=2689109 RepID=UPI001BFD6545|nr:4-(cytidine 5'-diphospho)-2-C-methyl-D-erythritol kinase [Polynucleobacter sp. MWH-Spelu-300-X4]QWD79646.1 4-(cytidine 5'-diphospho)-2-C-methyl-D-erythritol kinase [Polynucleobacter sp. MWH-Spelu-300-X4]